MPLLKMLFGNYSRVEFASVFCELHANGGTTEFDFDLAFAVLALRLNQRAESRLMKSRKAAVLLSSPEVSNSLFPSTKGILVPGALLH
jgi:hypothetical protein